MSDKTVKKKLLDKKTKKNPKAKLKKKTTSILDQTEVELTDEAKFSDATSPEFSVLSAKLHYHFKQSSLLKMALTHRSRGGEHNERLEFLGDAVVNFVIAEILYYQFPTATEGELSRFRASLVNRDALAELAKKFKLGDFLLLGPGEMRSGGSERQSILSCAMEAIIGAIYLDSRYEVVRQQIEKWYQPFLQSLSSAASHKDPKTILQEYVQSQHLPLPIYKVEKIEGEAHQQIFTVSCSIEGGKQKALGKGTSRRRAEQDAAHHMLSNCL